MTVFSHISTLKKDAFKNTANAFVPNSVLVPIKQDCENECEWLVKAGDIVSEGQIIAASYGGDFKSSVYSPIPGVVKGIELCVCPDGRMCEAARINLSGKFSFLGKTLKKSDATLYSDRLLLSEIEKNGIINTFTVNEPRLLASDISKAKKHSGSKLLVVRLFDEDPSRLTDALITKMFTENVLSGAEIVAAALGADGIVLASEKGFEIPSHSTKEKSEKSPDLVKPTDKKIPLFSIALNPKKYPAGYKDEIIRAVKKSLKSSPLCKGISKKSLFIDSSTAFETFRTVSFTMPVIDRYVYISGSCIPTTGILKVAIGTSIRDLAEQCGGFIKSPEAIIINGIVCGVSSGTLDAPITKYVKSITFLPQSKMPCQKQFECIQCGNCRRICPLHLSPDVIYSKMVFPYTRNADDVYIKTSELCNGCGLCSTCCPARLPLSQVIYKIAAVQNASTEIGSGMEER